MQRFGQHLLDITAAGRELSVDHQVAQAMHHTPGMYRDLHRPRSSLRSNDVDALRDATAAGLGIALLPTWLVGPDVRGGRLVELLPEWEGFIAAGPARAIWAVYLPKKVVSTKVRAFLSFFEQKFGRPPYWDASGSG